MYCSSWNSRCRCYRLPIPLTRKTCHSAEHLMSHVFWGLNFLGSMWNCDRVFLQAHPWSHLGVCVSQDEFWEELRKTGGRKTKHLQVEESLHNYKLWNVPKSLFFTEIQKFLFLWNSDIRESQKLSASDGLTAAETKQCFVPTNFSRPPPRPPPPPPQDSWSLSATASCLCALLPLHTRRKVIGWKRWDSRSSILGVRASLTFDS